VAGSRHALTLESNGQIRYCLLLVSTLCLKKTTPKAGRHKFYYFPNTKKIRNIRFVGNFVLRFIMMTSLWCHF